MKVVFIRFFLIPEGLIDKPEPAGDTSAEPEREAIIESKPIDPKRLEFIKHLVESGQIHD